jgi:hypothetical protein
MSEHESTTEPVAVPNVPVEEETGDVEEETPVVPEAPVDDEGGE